MDLEDKDYPHIPNEILFNRYRGGDLKAFNELLKRMKGLIYTLIMSYVHNHAQADEIFQEVFFKVCKNKDQFRESVSFKSWLVTITKNTCIDQLRRKKHAYKMDSLDGHNDDDRPALSEKIATPDPTPDENLAIQIENKELEDLLKQLPAEQSETFYLKVVMEMTFEEIGTSMDCSSNTAKSRYRYALDTLRGIVKRKKLLEKAV
ncbi:MAG: sigma-70 family RNA polymerase sigma factor [bacterium]|nr:sigma-70 family RNA polymerase sigma factor [bacterium]MBU1916869.1 sigma-70 family RNA polymerase sigma factor [bacterium]